MKNTIIVSSLLTTLLLIFVRSEFLLSYVFENYRGSFLANNLELVHNTLLLFPIVLLFSLVTYKAPERIFSAWWCFARIAVPVILFVTILSNLKLHHSPGGWMNMDDDIDRAVITLLYIFFVIGSLIQIVRGYFKR